MLLTLTTTHEPATDLGYLLVKHPDRVHEFDVPTGTAYVCFPEATAQRCTAALIVEPAGSGGPSSAVDRLTGGGRGGRQQPDGFTLGRFVNDRPYAAGSLLAGALNRAFRSAMRGRSAERPELAATPIPLTVRIPTLRCRGGADLAAMLLEPLGWRVQASPVPLDPTRPEWGRSRYVDLTIEGSARLADALNQVYVLLPVLDDAKHYWVAPDEIDKLLRAGTGWLAAHPSRDLIARRYLMHRRALTAVASERLDALRTAEGLTDPDTVDTPEAPSTEEGDALSLAEQRRRAVAAALAECGATRVLDLGCGSGALLGELVRDKRFALLVGVDISPQALALAARRLRLDQASARRHRVSLLQSALTYADDRLVGFDAAVLMEVIEHVDPPRLMALAAAVFGHAQPSTVVVTTPNVEYNARYEGLHGLRHHDHRFEWTRAEFATWCGQIAGRHGYGVRISGVGEEDATLGHPSQLAVFTKGGTT